MARLFGSLIVSLLLVWALAMAGSQYLITSDEARAAIAPGRSLGEVAPVAVETAANE